MPVVVSISPCLQIWSNVPQQMNDTSALLCLSYQTQTKEFILPHTLPTKHQREHTLDVVELVV